MCGRFALNASGEKIARALEADDIPESTASFNIPPGTHQLVACLDDDLKARFQALWWGFRPPWAGEDAPRPIAHLHPRMPLVLDPGCLRDWLDPSRQEREAVKAVTRPLPPARLRAWPVDPRVNRPANDDAGLIEPLG